MTRLTAGELRRVLKYDPATGDFIWAAGRRLGQKAGWKDAHGYISIEINGRNHKASRLAWLYMTGEHPTDLIDHKNRIRHDDRWHNLRAASRVQNNVNAAVRVTNKLQVKGVNGVGKKFRARVQHRGQVTHLGYFNTADEAHAAYSVAAQRIFGEYHHPG